MDRRAQLTTLLRSPVVLAAVARIASFLPAALCTFATSRIVLTHYGVSTYSSYTLALSVIALVPLNNVGVGNAVTSAVAAHGLGHQFSQRVLLTGVRVLSVMTLVLLLGSAGVTIAGSWEQVVGNAYGSNLFFGVSLLIYATTFVPALGQNVLLGQHRNHVTILLQSLLAPVSLLFVGLALLFGAGGRLLIIVPAVALALITLLTAVVSSRHNELSWSTLARRVVNRRRYPGESIRAISGPMVLVTLSLPLALEADRVVLSHVSTLTAVSDYAVIMQLFAPVAALVGAAAQPLWPMFIQSHATGGRVMSPFRYVIAFGVGALVICAVLCVFADPLGHLIGGDHINLGRLLPVAAAGVTLCGAISAPMAMFATDPAGLRVMAALVVTAAPLNLGLSIEFARLWGAAGPLLATIVVAIVVQILPGAIYLRRRRVENIKIFGPGMNDTGLDAGSPTPAEVLPDVPVATPSPRKRSSRDGSRFGRYRGVHRAETRARPRR